MAPKPPVIRPNQNKSRGWTGTSVTSSEDLLAGSCPSEHKKSRRIIRSFEVPDTVSASNNGLVNGVWEAYSYHHHLILRPEDIWFAILTQFSFYVNAHAEDLRYYFVGHEGQVEVIVQDGGSMDTADIGEMAIQLTHQMDKHIIDDDLRNWIMPDFSTTTFTDKVTSAILMLGTMQAYFKYTMISMCGIPSITLLGERGDWVNIRRRLDKLARYGKECEMFGSLLMPVLDNLVLSFDSPDDPAAHDFWNKICSDESLGSGAACMSGWITAFCFWDEKGKMLYHEPRDDDSDSSDYESGHRPPRSGFDVWIYHTIDIDKIPNGTVSVPVKYDDNGIIYKTRMVAGSVGMQWSSSGQALDKASVPVNEARSTDTDTMPPLRTGLDTLQPVSGWWMYELARDTDVTKDPEGDLVLEQIWTKLVDWRATDHNKWKDVELPRKRRRPNLHEIVLLGPPGSGKTSFLRALELNEQEDAPSRREEFKKNIRDDVVRSMQEALKGLGLENFLALLSQGTPPDIGPVIRALRSNPQVQARAQGSAQYYLNNLERIYAPDYVPTDEDILHCDLLEITTSPDPCSYHFVDVSKLDQQRWVSCLANAEVIIVLIDLLDQPMENIAIFHSIQPLLASKTILARFNRSDLFKQKLLEVPFKSQDFESSDYNDTTEYLVMQLARDDAWLHSDFGNVTDQTRMRFMMATMNDLAVNHECERG